MFVCMHELAFALILTNLHASLEAVDWRMVQVTMRLLRLKYVHLDQSILGLIEIIITSQFIP